MVDVSEIVDKDSFERWLKGLPRGSDAERDESQRWAMLLAHRAAMRVLPKFWAWRLTTPLPVGGVTALAILRISVSGGVAGKSLSPPIKRAAVHAAAAHAAIAAAADATAATGAAATAAGSAAYATATEYAGVAATAARFAATALAAAWPALRADCTALLSGADPSHLPLWSAENPLASEWSSIRTHPTTQSPGWRFWIDWYDRALTGQPQDWALLEKVALIDPTDWDKGEDHVNALILQMVDQHALLLETRRLKAENERLAEQLRALEHRSHNHPPELVEDLAPIKTSTTIIWAALDDAERELGKPKPDRGALKKVAEALLTVTKAVGNYCLRLADTMAQGAARAAGAALVAGLGFAGLLTSMNADIAALAGNLLRLAGSLLP